VGASPCKENEEADKLAKSLKYPEINIRVQMSNADIKGLIWTEVKKSWQKIWDNEISPRRHLYSIHRNVGVERTTVNNMKQDVIMTRLRFGQTTLNQSLHKIGKHEGGNCDKYGYPETVKRILLEYVVYNRERDFFLHQVYSIK